MDINKLKQIP